MSRNAAFSFFMSPKKKKKRNQFRVDLFARGSTTIIYVLSLKDYQE